MKNKKYSIEVKNRITQEICEQRRSTSTVAKENGISLKTVEKWVTQYHKDKNVFKRRLDSPENQVKMLTNEVKRLNKQVDILKKTISLIEKKE